MLIFKDYLILPSHGNVRCVPRYVFKWNHVCPLLRSLIVAKIQAGLARHPAPILQPNKNYSKMSISPAKLRSRGFVPKLSALASSKVCEFEQNLGFSEKIAKHQLCTKWQNKFCRKWAKMLVSRITYFAGNSELSPLSLIVHKMCTATTRSHQIEIRDVLP